MFALMIHTSDVLYSSLVAGAGGGFRSRLSPRRLPAKSYFKLFRVAKNPTALGTTRQSITAHPVALRVHLKC